MNRLTSKELKIVYFIEQHWHENSSYPRDTDVCSEFGIHFFDLRKLYSSPQFKAAMNNRGIPAKVVKAPTPKTKAKNQPPDSKGASVGSALMDPALAVLTNAQIAAVTVVTNFADKRPMEKKLKDLGILPSQWGGWMKQKRFKEFLHRLTSDNFHDSLHVANEGILKAVERGDVNAARFYYEVTGRYKAGSESIINIRVLLAKVVEVLQYHIADPNVLSRIGEDLQAIMAGEEPPNAYNPDMIANRMLVDRVALETEPEIESVEGEMEGEEVVFPAPEPEIKVSTSDIGNRI